MRVLVTGHRGYIGSVLTCVLRHARFDVVGLDCNWYDGCDFGRTVEAVPCFDGDARDIEFTDLLSFDAIVHLAALPDDADGEFDDHIIDEINYHAAIHLAECAKRADVPRLIFASCCSVYGRGGSSLLDEQRPTSPSATTARSKLRCERDLALLADDRFTPVFLRIGEVYGVSPRLRLDLIVNDLVGSAVTHGRVMMRHGAAGWRSLIHVEDLCRAIASVLTAPTNHVHNQVFNVVAPDQHCRTIDLADRITDMLPLCTRSVVVETYDDHSRRIDGSKLRKALPSLTCRWQPSAGIRQLQNAMVSAGLMPGDWRSDRYRRILRLKSLVERHHLDRSLRHPCSSLIQRELG